MSPGQIQIGKLLIVVGILCALAGVVLLLPPKIPWFGRLPGDIRIQRENFSFYFPITTCIFISLIISLIIRLFKK